jgi:hypothetical protein
VSDTGQAQAQKRTHTDGWGPPVSDTEGEREGVGAGETASGPRMSGSSSSLAANRVVPAGHGQQRCGEGGAHAGVDDWPEGHGTTMKQRRRPSPANAHMQIRNEEREKGRWPEIFTSGRAWPR